MARRLVCVHGIGGPREPAAELRAWMDGLARGMEEAGHSALAKHIGAGEPGGAIDVSFAYYGDLFRRPQEQGQGDLLPGGGAEAILAELLTELVDALAAEHAASDAPHDGEWEHGQRMLRLARAEAAPAAQSQGAAAVLRRAVNVATTLLSWKPWRGAARRMTPRLMVGDLAQVARYLAREEPDAAGVTLDRRIRRRVADAIGDEGPAVVVAHSLGSVVAWEALHELDVETPLFVTAGSPLAMRTVVLPRLVPQPPKTPERVAEWLNFWDKDDIIAVRPVLERDVGANTSAVAPVSRRVDSDGAWVHSVRKYLARPGVAGPIAQALTPPHAPYGH